VSAKLAIITPWPPQHTGIADYAYDLVWGLVELGYKVSVICETKDPKPIDGVDFYPPEWVTEETRKHFDELVYHIGNNTSFHIFQLPLLFKFPGVIHLHDMVLHHLMAWLLYVKGNPRLYRTVLAKWYGPLVAIEAWTALKERKVLWERPTVTDVPFFEEVLQYATTIIIHSEYAEKKIRAVFPGTPVKVLPQVYREVMPRSQLDPHTFHIGILGGVDPNKRLDLIIEALLAACETGCSIQLHIVGKVNADCEHLIERINKSPLAPLTHIHGRVEHEAFLQLISAMDLCLAMRYPTMGETSAVVMRALQAGTPVIVNDVGWYAELPGFLPKLQPAEPDEVKKLTDLLVTLSRKGPEYLKLMEETRQYAEKEWQFYNVVQRYADYLLTENTTCQ
jgi:glycosyltransferase involved in cell wall biosynthesis